MNIKVGRYSTDTGQVPPLTPPIAFDEVRDGRLYLQGAYTGHDLIRHWQGWLEDEERTWIAFIDMEGRPTFFLNRCSHCGGVTDGPDAECSGPNDCLIPVDDEGEPTLPPA